MSAASVIDKGVGRLQGVQFKSPDAEATVEGEIDLAQPIATSRIDLYVRFKLSDSLLRSSEKLRTIMDFTAQMGKRPDGFIGFRMTGSFQNMSSVQWLQTSPFASGTSPVKPTPPVRPAIGAPPPPPAAAPPAPSAPIPIPEVPPPVPPPPAPVPPPTPAPPPAPVPPRPRRRPRLPPHRNHHPRRRHPRRRPLHPPAEQDQPRAIQSTIRRLNRYKAKGRPAVAPSIRCSDMETLVGFP